MKNSDPLFRPIDLIVIFVLLVMAIILTILGG